MSEQDPEGSVDRRWLIINDVRAVITEQVRLGRVGLTITRTFSNNFQVISGPTISGKSGFLLLGGKER